jgi:hypothetical protein
MPASICKINFIYVNEDKTQKATKMDEDKTENGTKN